MNELYPPLCPNTEETFREPIFECLPYLTCSLHPDLAWCLSSFFPEDRRFLARYQAFAWLDIHDKMQHAFVTGQLPPGMDWIGLV